MRAILKKCTSYIAKENRLLVFTFAFLFVFSLATYALAGTPPGSAYTVSDNITDPTCLPGTTNCYVLPSGGVGGSGTANQIAYWNSSSTLTGDTGLTWNPTTKLFSMGSASTEGILYIGTGSSGSSTPLQGLVLDVNDSAYTFGNGNTNHDSLFINDKAGTDFIKFSQPYGGSTDTTLSLDAHNGVFKIGDINNNNNGVKLDLESTKDYASIQDSLTSDGLQYFGSGYADTPVLYKGLTLDIKDKNYVLGNPTAANIGISDNTGAATISGLGYPTPHLSTPIFTGSGANDLTPSGTYTGSGTENFKITATVDRDGVTYTGISGGSFVAGATLHWVGGVDAMVLYADANVLILASIGGSPPSGTITQGSVTATVVSNIHTDTFSWSSTNAPTSHAYYPMYESPLGLIDGVFVSFGAFSGHIIGDSWQFTASTGNRALALDPLNSLYQIGDLDGAGHATRLVVNDAAQMTTVTGGVTINGNLLINGATTCAIGMSINGIACSSDQRLKTNIQDLPTELSEINKLRPVTYTWIDPKKPQTTNIGFIAQDVQQIFPQFVGQVGDYLGIDYAGLITPTIKAVQELDLKVEPLTSIDPTVDGSLASLIGKFLQNAAVTIKDATINTLHIGGQVCVDDVCVTKDQFKQLLLQAGGTATDSSTTTSGSGTTTVSTSSGTTTGTTSTPPDTTPPVITLLGSATVTLTVGDTYTDAGATASDDTDGNLTSHIVTVNPVDATKAGTYTITYDVQDAAGNHAVEVTRTVTVNAAAVVPTNPDPTPTPDPNTTPSASSGQ